VANLSLVFDVLARDQASATLRKVGDEVERTGKKTEGLSDSLAGHAQRVDGFASSIKGFGATIGGLALVSTFKGIYDAAAESAKISRLTENVIRSTGGAANVSAKQVGDLATAISNKTGVDDEAIQSGENLLLTFTNVRNEVGKGNDIFNQATSVITDMSVALGQDTSTSAIQLGKALNDPIKGVSALQRVGVSFTESQKDQIKTLVESGKTMEAQKLILGELTKEFGGAAEAASTPLDKLLVRLGNMAEEIGTAVTPAVNGMVDALQATLNVGGDVVGFIGGLPGPLQAAAGAATIWALAGDKITGAYGTARDKVKAFREEAELQRALMSMQSRDISDADRALGGLGTSLDATGAKFGTAKAAVGAFARAIGPELAIAAGAFVVGEIIDGIQSLTQASDDAKAAAEGLAQSLNLSDAASNRRAVQDAIKDVDGLVEVLQRAGVSSETATAGLLGNKRAQDEVTAALQRYIGTVNTRGDDGAESVRQARMAYEELATGYGNAASNARFFGDAATASGASAQGAADETSAASEQTQADAEAAQQALDDWINKLASIDDAFVDPLSTYQTMLQAAAQSTADSTASQKDSWKDFVDTTKVNLDDYAAKLEEQIANQENWHKNLAIIAQRAGYDVATQLQQMGSDGVGLVAQMANGTDAEMQRMAGLLRQDAANGGAGAAQALDQQMKIMAAIGAAGANATATGIASQLQIGADVVARVAQQYGVNLANGINPLLTSLGKGQVIWDRSVVAGYGHFAVGGYTGDGAKYTPAGIVHRGEFVFPQESVNRLGVGFLGALAGLPGYATGGFVTAADVPRPPSTAPYRPPISQAGDATMSTAHDAAVDWINKNMLSSVDPGGSGVQRWASLVLRALSMMGQPASLLGAVLRRMNQESGGNPRAINLWDINAKRGTPSKGLMQTIDPTFRAYHFPGTSNDIYDPLANILASMRYAMARYGSLAAAYNRAGGYKLGTDFVPEDGLAYLHRGEAVVPADRNQGAPWTGGGSVVLQLDGPATSALLEGKAVTVLADAFAARSDRIAYGS
jgi:hypothetical protein